MQFRLTYQEISDLIARKAGRSIPVLYGGPHTVRIGIDVNVLFKTTNIGREWKYLSLL
jgi:tetrahydromethanopterin S-methyltransferase subunit G